MNYLWTPTSLWSSTLELRDGQAVVASMKFRGSSRTRAEAVSLKGRWTLKQTGIWKPHVIMQGAGDPLIAKLTWCGGAVLTLRSGETLRWKARNVWQSSYGWTTADGRVLVRYQARSLTSRTRTVTVVAPLPLEDPLPLILLGGFLLEYSENAAAAATVAAMG